MIYFPQNIKPRNKIYAKIGSRNLFDNFWQYFEKLKNSII